MFDENVVTWVERVALKYRHMCSVLACIDSRSSSTSQFAFFAHQQYPPPPIPLSPLSLLVRASTDDAEIAEADTDADTPAGSLPTVVPVRNGCALSLPNLLGPTSSIGLCVLHEALSSSTGRGPEKQRDKRPPRDIA